MTQITHSPLQRAKLFVHIILAAATICIAIPFIFIMGPIIEGTYFPVTTAVKVKLLRVEGDKMIFHAFGNKVRDCKMVDVKTLVDIAGDGLSPQKGVIYVINDGVGDAIRPRGLQDLGIWAIHPNGKRIEVQTWYQCHPFWNTYTVLGTYPNVETLHEATSS